MSKKRGGKSVKSRKGKRSASGRRSKSQGRSSSSSGSSSGGGAMMSLRGGFKGAVGSVTGKKPKTRWGSIVSNIVWTLLTVAALALLAYKLYKVL